MELFYRLIQAQSELFCRDDKNQFDKKPFITDETLFHANSGCGDA